MADAKVTGLKAIQDRIARLPKAAEKALRKQLTTEGDDMVSAIQRAMDAQYADSGDHGHQKLRDSVHAYPNPDRAISVRILADAKDADGKFLGSNVEQGHRTVDGGHVAGRPAFFPTYRARKKAMKRRLSKAARDAIKQSFEQGS
jgi:hypothetical protein